MDENNINNNNEEIDLNFKKQKSKDLNFPTCKTPVFRTGTYGPKAINITGNYQLIQWQITYVKSNWLYLNESQEALYHWHDWADGEWEERLQPLNNLSPDTQYTVELMQSNSSPMLLKDGGVCLYEPTAEYKFTFRTLPDCIRLTGISCDLSLTSITIGTTSISLTNIQISPTNQTTSWDVYGQVSPPYYLSYYVKVGTAAEVGPITLNGTTYSGIQTQNLAVGSHDIILRQANCTTVTVRVTKSLQVVQAVPPVSKCDTPTISDVQWYQKLNPNEPLLYSPSPYVQTIYIGTHSDQLFATLNDMYLEDKNINDCYTYPNACKTKLSFTAKKAFGINKITLYIKLIAENSYQYADNQVGIITNGSESGVVYVALTPIRFLGDIGKLNFGTYDLYWEVITCYPGPGSQITSTQSDTQRSLNYKLKIEAKNQAVCNCIKITSINNLTANPSSTTIGNTVNISWNILPINKQTPVTYTAYLNTTDLGNIGSTITTYQISTTGKIQGNYTFYLTQKNCTNVTNCTEAVVTQNCTFILTNPVTCQNVSNISFRLNPNTISVGTQSIKVDYIDFDGTNTNRSLSIKIENVTNYSTILATTYEYTLQTNTLSVGSYNIWMKITNCTSGSKEQSNTLTVTQQACIGVSNLLFGLQNNSLVQGQTTAVVMMNFSVNGATPRTYYYKIGSNQQYGNSIGQDITIFTIPNSVTSVLPVSTTSSEHTIYLKQTNCSNNSVEQTQILTVTSSCTPITAMTLSLNPNQFTVGSTTRMTASWVTTPGSPTQTLLFYLKIDKKSETGGTSTNIVPESLIGSNTTRTTGAVLQMDKYTVGTYEVTMRQANCTSGTQTAIQNFTIIAAACTSLTSVSLSLSSSEFTYGSQTKLVPSWSPSSGATTPITYQITGSAWPGWSSAGTDTTTLTPGFDISSLVIGTYSLTIRQTNCTNTQKEDTKTFEIKAAPVNCIAVQNLDFTLSPTTIAFGNNVDLYLTNFLYNMYNTGVATTPIKFQYKIDNGSYCDIGTGIYSYTISNSTSTLTQGTHNVYLKQINCTDKFSEISKFLSVTITCTNVSNLLFSLNPVSMIQGSTSQLVMQNISVSGTTPVVYRYNINNTQYSNSIGTDITSYTIRNGIQTLSSGSHTIYLKQTNCTNGSVIQTATLTVSAACVNVSGITLTLSNTNFQEGSIDYVVPSWVITNSSTQSQNIAYYILPTTTNIEVSAGINTSTLTPGIYVLNTTPGSYNVTVTQTNCTNGSQSNTQSFTISQKGDCIAPTPTGNTTNITTDSALLNFIIGNYFPYNNANNVLEYTSYNLWYRVKNISNPDSFRKIGSTNQYYPPATLSHSLTGLSQSTWYEWKITQENYKNTCVKKLNESPIYEFQTLTPVPVCTSQSWNQSSVSGGNVIQITPYANSNIDNMIINGKAFNLNISGINLTGTAPITFDVLFNLANSSGAVLYTSVAKTLFNNIISFNQTEQTQITTIFSTNSYYQNTNCMSGYVHIRANNCNATMLQNLTIGTNISLIIIPNGVTNLALTNTQIQQLSTQNQSWTKPSNFTNLKELQYIQRIYNTTNSQLVYENLALITTSLQTIVTVSIIPTTLDIGSYKLEISSIPCQNQNIIYESPKVFINFSIISNCIAIISNPAITAPVPNQIIIIDSSSTNITWTQPSVGSDIKYNLYINGTKINSTELTIQNQPYSYKFTEQKQYTIKLEQVNGCTTANLRKHEITVYGCIVQNQPVLTSPADNSEDFIVRPTFQWNQSTQGSDVKYDIYIGTTLNNLQILQANLTVNSYLITYNLQISTMYYWKVVQKNSCSTGQSSAVFKFTTRDCIEYPQVPVLLTPIYNQVGVQMDTRSFTWNNAQYQTSYDLYMGIDSIPDVSLPIIQSDLLVTNYTYNFLLLGNTVYKWKVVQKNECGITSSQIWKFTTKNCLVMPNQFSIITPTHESLNLLKNFEITWEDQSLVNSAISYYEVYVGLSEPAMTKVQTVLQTQERKYIYNGQLNTTYYMYIKQVNDCGNKNSNIVKITTIDCESNPLVELKYPTNGQTDVQTNTVLQWESSNYKNFDIYFGINITLNISDILNNTRYTSLNIQTPNLAVSTTYYWKVQQQNNCGNTDSPIFSFVTRNCITKPTNVILITPINGQVNIIQLNVFFRWNQDGQDDYDLYLTNNQNSINLDASIIQRDIVLNTYTYYTTILLDTQYYWKIKQKNVCGETDSQVFTFTTKDCLVEPNAPQLIYPTHNQDLVPFPIMFQWEDLESQKYYILYYGQSLQELDTFKHTNIINNYFIVISLEIAKRYYWKVEQVNDCGTSLQSDVFQFTTIDCLYIPQEFTLMEPPDDSINLLAVNVLFRWTKSGTIGSGQEQKFYNLYVSQDEIINEQDLIQTNIIGLQYVKNLLNTDSVYYWKVIQYNNCGERHSPIFIFKTLDCITQPQEFDLLTPTYDQHNVRVSGKFTWEESEGQKYYTVYIKKVQDINYRLLYDRLILAECNYYNLDFDCEYNWYVVQENNCGSTTCNNIFKFTTISQDCLEPTFPSDPEPPDGQEYVPVNIILRWKESYGKLPITYTVYLEKDNHDPQIVLNSFIYTKQEIELHSVYSYGLDIIADRLTLMSFDESPLEDPETYPVISPRKKKKVSYERYFYFKQKTLMVGQKLKRFKMYSENPYPCQGQTLYFKTKILFELPKRGTSIEQGMKIIPEEPLVTNLFINGNQTQYIDQQGQKTDYGILQLEIGQEQPHGLTKNYVWLQYDEYPPELYPPLDPDSDYYWRVKQTNECGEVMGPIWRFSTGQFDD